ncbi:hypothetical protein QYF61_023507 [Mycteria americana]|uniref:Uncharacterized protein n=1 Tax=Mycteria americana TaxID=33587 RepID=A0AAN7S9T2_MYCAM|nr:hypothetical protein QYF61_023507 [Mycteria americana]
MKFDNALLYCAKLLKGSLASIHRSFAEMGNLKCYRSEGGHSHPTPRHNLLKSFVEIIVASRLKDSPTGDAWRKWGKTTRSIGSVRLEKTESNRKPTLPTPPLNHVPKWGKNFLCLHTACQTRSSHVFNSETSCSVGTQPPELEDRDTEQNEAPIIHGEMVSCYTT